MLDLPQLKWLRCLFLYSGLRAEPRSLARMTRISSALHSISRLPAIVSLAVIVLNASAAFAQPSLGSAGNFGALGATTVTNTGLTVVTGDVGVSPGTAITGFPPGVVTGTIHPGDMVAAQAHADAFMASEGLKAMPCNTMLTGQDLGGMTLTTGVYCFASSAQLTGTLHLAGPGPWVFKIGSTLTTATASSVVRTPATTCSGSNVFWQVGSSATLGTGTMFIGNILAVASITATTGVNVSGSLLAINGAVTMDTNLVSACGSSVVPPPDEDDCKKHHDKCKCKCKCKHHDGHDDGDHNGDDHDCDHDGHGHHDGDDDGHHGDNDHDKDSKDKGHDKDSKDKGHDKDRNDHNSKDKNDKGRDGKGGK
jgi:ice-binding like protein